MLRLLCVTIRIELGVFCVLALALPIGDAVGQTLLLFFPSLWAPRLILSYRSGRITERLLFLANSNLASILSLSNPRVLERETQRWQYQIYFLRGCGAWALLLANMVLPSVSEL